jgi:formate dehydrogenase beta subunit
MAEQIKFVNLEWLDSNFPCMSACPVHTEAGRYVGLIEEGKYREAYSVARRPNPFASICGRVCAAPCETACRRGEIDQPIAIRALKRFVCEKFGVESMMDLEKLKEVFGKSVKRNGIRVAVIGSGPAGLSCAHDLALQGYEVTVFEAQSVAGGMLRLGIPEYRLPRELIRLEINAILSLGVELKLNVRLGKDFTIASLREEGYQAFFIAIGAHKSRDLTIEGVELDGVLRAVDYLLNVNLGYRMELGEKVIVIGGGSVAIDVARSAVRHESREAIDAASTQVTEVTQALDVARSAIRFGAKEVHMVCLEDWNEMPAPHEEIEEAKEERIHIHPHKGPNKIIGVNGKVTGLQTVDCLSVFDENKRFSPKFAPNSEKIIEADTVIMAIGQTSDLSWIDPKDGIEITPRNTIKIDPVTLATTAPGIYAGGDVSFGPRIAIDAIANGKLAARSIHKFLTGNDKQFVEVDLREDHVEIIVANTKSYSRPWGYESIPRVPIPALDIDRRVGVSQIEIGYSEEEARREASRCLHCWENTVFNKAGEDTGSECILCGGCVDICPESCIDLVIEQRVGFDESLIPDLRESYNVVLAGSTEDTIGSVMIKNEERCIRCGLCAMRCPVGCITMESYSTSAPMPITMK